MLQLLLSLTILGVEVKYAAIRGLVWTCRYKVAEGFVTLEIDQFDGTAIEYRQGIKQDQVMRKAMIVPRL